MQELNLYLTISVATLAAIALLSNTLLRGWREWLSYKHAELASGRDDHRHVPSATARIEIADLKERIRKLEAIASGVEL